MTVSQRVSQERKSELGTEVGFHVGLNKVSDGNNTKILFCTTGVVLQRLIHEKNLKRYSHIILDEGKHRDVHFHDFSDPSLPQSTSATSPSTFCSLSSDA